MSGSGTSGYGDGFWGQGESCEKLMVHTQLSSPVAAIISKLVVGSVMAVVSRPGSGITLVEAQFNGKLAGGIASAQIARLIQCLAEGYQYKATVTAINGGQVKIRVEVA